MADVVTTQIIANGNRNLIMKFTNESDGTGETGVKKVDAQSSTIATSQGFVPGVHLKIARITFTVSGGELRMQWDASAPTDIDILAYTGTQDYTFFGGLTNPNATGATGSILFTTVGFVAGSSYTVVLEMLKCV